MKRSTVLVGVVAAGFGCGTNQPEHPSGVALRVVNEAGDAIDAAVGSRCGRGVAPSGSCQDDKRPLRNLPVLQVKPGERLRLLYGLRVDTAGEGYVTASVGNARLPEKDLRVRRSGDDDATFETVLPTRSEDTWRYLHLSATFNEGDTSGSASFQVRLDGL